jgi:hypothetical protein
MRCTVPVPIPNDLATFKIPTPFASCFRTFRSVALSIFGRPSAICGNNVPAGVEVFNSEHDMLVRIATRDLDWLDEFIRSRSE